MPCASRPWEPSGSIDVERLAAWAYGSQMVDRFERAGLHAVEAAAAGFEPSAYSADGVGQLMQIEHLGCRIDRSSAFVADTCHPVAYAVAGAVADLDGRSKLRAHAAAGTRPSEWKPPADRIRARVWKREGVEAQIEYQGPGRKGAYCPVIVVWDANREAWGRAQYTLWWEALAELAWKLSLRALGFTVTGPAAPPEPWVEAKRAEPSSISIDSRAGGHPPRGSSEPDPKAMGCGSAGLGSF